MIRIVGALDEARARVGGARWTRAVPAAAPSVGARRASEGIVVTLIFLVLFNHFAFP